MSKSQPIEGHINDVPVVIIPARMEARYRADDRFEDLDSYAPGTPAAHKWEIGLLHDRDAGTRRRVVVRYMDRRAVVNTDEQLAELYGANWREVRERDRPGERRSLRSLSKRAQSACDICEEQRPLQRDRGRGEICSRCMHIQLQSSADPDLLERHVAYAKQFSTPRRDPATKEQVPVGKELHA